MAKNLIIQNPEIKRISWQQALPLRHEVLWPTKPLEYCHVAGDDSAIHFGLFVADKLVCVASVFVDDRCARLRKFATSASFQGRGLGSAMLSHIIAELRNDGVTYFWCDARESAVEFYKRFGLHPEGDRFFKADVPYFKMSVEL